MAHDIHDGGALRLVELRLHGPHVFFDPLGAFSLHNGAGNPWLPHDPVEAALTDGDAPLLPHHGEALLHPSDQPSWRTPSRPHASVGRAFVHSIAQKA